MTVANVSGAAGGFVSSAAGPLLIVALAIALVAVPLIREGLIKTANQTREHFLGPLPQPDTSATNQAPGTTPASSAGGEAGASATSGRASDRDEYDFDLDVLSQGDSC